MILASLALWTVQAGGAPQAPEPAILARVPSELPRAAEGRWEGFLDPSSVAAHLAGLDVPVRAALSAAEQSYRREDLPGTLDPLYEALTLAPDLPPAWLLCGTTYFRLRRYEDAIHCFERLLAVAPGEVWRTQALGHAYYSVGAFAKARAHYERVLAAAPEGLPVSPEALRGLALAHMRLGDEAEALRLLGRVAQIDPSRPEAPLWIARILYDQERPSEAFVQAERARDLAPHEPGPWYLLTQIHFDLGHDEEAEAARVRWRELDRLAQEIRFVEASLRVRPDDPAALERLVELKQTAGDTLGVREALGRLVAARPAGSDELEPRLHALDVLWELGDREGALEAARALETACPERWEAWRRLETFYAAIGDLQGRIRAGERYRRLRP